MGHHAPATKARAASGMAIRRAGANQPASPASRNASVAHSVERSGKARPGAPTRPPASRTRPPMAASVASRASCRSPRRIQTLAAPGSSRSMAPQARRAANAGSPGRSSQSRAHSDSAAATPPARARVSAPAARSASEPGPRPGRLITNTTIPSASAMPAPTWNGRRWAAAGMAAASRSTSRGRTWSTESVRPP